MISKKHKSLALCLARPLHPNKFLFDTRVTEPTQ